MSYESRNKPRGIREAVNRGEEQFWRKRGKKRPSRFSTVRFDRVDDFGAVSNYQIDARIEP